MGIWHESENRTEEIYLFMVLLVTELTFGVGQHGLLAVLSSNGAGLCAGLPAAAILTGKVLFPSET